MLTSFLPSEAVLQSCAYDNAISRRDEYETDKSKCCFNIIL